MRVPTDLLVGGAKAFGIGGVIVAAVWLVFGAFRPDGIHTHLAAWPWLPARFWLQARRALSVAGDVFDERETGMLIPLLFGVIAGGLVLGIYLADARTRTGERQVKASRASRILKSLQ